MRLHTKADFAETVTGNWQDDNFAFDIVISIERNRFFKVYAQCYIIVIQIGTEITEVIFCVDLYQNKYVVHTYQISLIFTVPMFDMSKSLKLSLMLTGPVPWSIPNCVIRSGSIGYNPKLGTPEMNG